MASSAAKLILHQSAKKSKTKEKKFQKQQFFDLVEARDGKGRMVKVKEWREPWCYLPAADRELLEKVRKRAAMLDNQFKVLGIRFGVSSIVGFVPEIGDVIDGLMSYNVIRTAMKVTDSNEADAKKLKTAMWRNLAIDVIVGLIPLLGDFADTFFRCNMKNARLFEKMLRKRGEQEKARLDKPDVSHSNGASNNASGTEVESLLSQHHRQQMTKKL